MDTEELTLIPAPEMLFISTVVLQEEKHSFSLNYAWERRDLNFELKSLSLRNFYLEKDLYNDQLFNSILG